MDVAFLQEELKRWGELIIPAGGSIFEIHGGDNVQFDVQKTSFDSRCRIRAEWTQHSICKKAFGTHR